MSGVFMISVCIGGRID